MIKELNKLRMNFPQFKQASKNNFIYLDNAATSLKPQTMIDGISKFYSEYIGNINRTFSLMGNLDAVYYDSIEIIKKYFNVGPEYEVIFTSGATESINIVANCFVSPMLKDGDSILTSIYEHHSNYLPWKIISDDKKCSLVEVDYNHTNGFKINNEHLNNCKFAAFTNASNVTGTLFRVGSIINKFHSKNIPVLIDAAQSAPHSKIDIDKLNADFVVFSAHKMLGPFGIGALVVKKIHLDNMKPWKYGGGMVKNVSINKWQKGAVKYEAGTQDPTAVIGWASALEFLDEIGMTEIENHTKYLTKILHSNLKEDNNITIYSEPNISENVGIVSFDYKGVHSHDIGEWLNYNDIIVRVGHLCAQPLLNKLKVKSLIRTSLYFYNSEEDIQKMTQAIRSISDCLKGEISHEKI